MGNRKLPFGYQMRMGEIIRNEPEAKAVQDIFLQYTLGASLKEIAEQMSKTGLTYDEGKSWNKNMVARILENAKYTGADNYPKLVDIKLFEAAAEKRQTKQRLPERTPAQKALKRVCSKPSTPEIEQQVMHLLSRLAEQPERITQPERTSAPVHTNAEAELDDTVAHTGVRAHNRKVVKLLAVAGDKAHKGLIGLAPELCKRGKQEGQTLFRGLSRRHI